MARPAERARLEHERATLDAARHPGVVAVVGWHELEGGGAELATSFVGSRSLTSVARLAPEQVAAVGAAVATTLADLHALGITHGALDESHVLLDRDGRPVLCGFAMASVQGVGPPGTEGSPAEPADDVEALGSLLTRLLSTETEADPIPDHRWPFSRSGRRSTWLRRLLLSLADQATYPDAHRRPSAAALARSLSETVTPGTPPATLDTCAQKSQDHRSPPSGHVDERSSVAPPRRRERSRARWLPVTAVAGLLLIGGGALSWLQPGSGADPDVNEALVEAAESPSIQTLRSNAVTAADAVAGDTTTTAPVRAPGPPPTVMSQGRRYAVGAPGDLAVLGDWDCDHVPTVALIRPATGEVFVFDGWAEASELSVTATTLVAGASSGEARASASGCDVLIVTNDEGTTHEIDLDEH
jgi:hypothetical protein